MAENQTVEANQDALDNLPANEQKETKEILDEISAEAGKKEGEDAKDEAAVAAKAEEDRRAALTEEERVAEDAAKAKTDADAQEAKSKLENVKPEPRRKAPKLMPVYVHKVAENKWQQEKEQLLADIDTIFKSNSSKEGETEEAKAARVAKIKTVAEKHGYEPEFVTDLLAIATENDGKLPPEVEQGLRKAHGLAAERDLEVEDASYSADFDKIILPLIKAEYGNDVPKNVISDIKEDLKGLAYSDEYAKVPYQVIYQGNNDFRELVAPKSKGGEGSRGGTGGDGAGAAEKLDLSKPLTDAQISGLSGADFDTYAANMSKQEKESSRK